MPRFYVLLILVSTLMGCGRDSGGPPSGPYADPGPNPVPAPYFPPIGEVGEDGFVVRGRAEMTISSERESEFAKLFSIFMPKAWAATGATTVTYSNAGVTVFTLDTTALAVSPSFTGDTLNLGNIVLSNIDDNTLKVCGVGGNQKCTQAIIRFYTTTAPADTYPSTGTTPGFVNVSDAADLYGVPVYAGSLNPTTQVPYGATGAVQTQVVTIPSNLNRVRLTHFGALSARTYAVSSDFSNAGSGQYKMRLVVEYALQ